MCHCMSRLGKQSEPLLQCMCMIRYLYSLSMQYSEGMKCLQLTGVPDQALRTLSLPLKTTTVVAGSSHSAATLSYTVGFTRVSA